MERPREASSKQFRGTRLLPGLRIETKQKQPSRIHHGLAIAYEVVDAFGSRFARGKPVRD